MPRKKVDNRIRVMVENGVALRQRTMFVIVGDKGRDQVVVLHHMLCKASLRARPSVLWCYKKELGFSTHRKKRMRQVQRKLKAGGVGVNEENPFELFVAATTIRYCYYSEAHKIMGNTYGMCVLQDFEALRPNLLARTVETVEGGGIVVVLLRSMTSLRQLYTLTMDIHSHYSTEARKNITGRFNERFLLSLASCPHTIVMDDQLNILPISSHVYSVHPVLQKSKDQGEASELTSMKQSLEDTPPVGPLVNCARTVDQAKALLMLVEAISEKTLHTTVTVTAGRGRGKSAALGLGIAAAVSFGYANIFVSSPSPENLKTLFEFVMKGFDALGYSEHEDYELVQSTSSEFGKAVVRVNVFHDHRQTVQYVHPSDSHKLGQAELVCIDEAAAIPLPLVKGLLGPYLVFLASTVNGYEGTGRSLSLKLFRELRQQSSFAGGQSSAGRVLKEVSLSEPIRYAAEDPVEAWLHSLLCLDATSLPKITTGCPPPNDCELYLVNRDTLFCYHKASEQFLQKIVALFVASHYKNTPNDLQLLSDAPAHCVFVLLPPVTAEQSSLPDILCVLQVCLEGQISRDSVMKSLSRGKRAHGDLIPWTVSQQFVDHDFAGLSGARIVRIATHPDLQGMGYGSRALQLLTDYYEGKVTTLTEDMPPSTSTAVEPPQLTGEGLLREHIAPRSKLPPLLMRLSECPPEQLDYLGVSYGLTHQLLRFWKRAGYLPVYLRQTPNELTGEHSCIMLQALATPTTEQGWLHEYHEDFRRRFLSLLSYQFREFPAQLALAVVHQKTTDKKGTLSVGEMRTLFSRYDLKRLELYSRNMADHHLITDLLPALARLYFTMKTSFSLSVVQATLLLGMGLQHKTVEALERESDLPASQIMGLYNRTMRKFVQQLRGVEEEEAGEQLAEPPQPPSLEPVQQPMEEDLSTAADEVRRQQKEYRSLLEAGECSEYVVSGVDTDWEQALGSGRQTGIVSIARAPKRRKVQDPQPQESVHKKRRKPKRRQ